jgi:hypothetical protein
MKLSLQTGAHYNRLKYWYIKYFKEDKLYYCADEDTNLPLSASTLILIL